MARPKTPEEIAAEQAKAQAEAQRQAEGRAAAEARGANNISNKGTLNLTPTANPEAFPQNPINQQTTVAGQDFKLAPQARTTEVAPTTQPRLADGSINPNYVPGSGLKTNDGELATRTSGLPLQDKMRIEQQQTEATRANDIQTAFGQAQSMPLPSLFDPSLTNVNWGGVGFAALNKGLTMGATGGAAALLGGAATGIASGAAAGATAGAATLNPVGLAVGVIGGAILGGLTAGISEARNQKKDTIKLATASYDRAEGLRRELINSARQGADPYEVISQYKQIEQIKRTSREALEFAARKDPTGFSDEARAKLYEMKQQETSEMRFIRDQRLASAMLNPSRDAAPDVQQTMPLTN